MKIGIIGSQERAAAIGRLLSQLHEVSFSDPKAPDRAQALAQSLSAQAMSPYDQVMRSDLLVFALPWEQVDRALAAAGKIGEVLVVDATLAPLGAKNTSRLLARKLDDGHVVKAFSTLEPATLLARSGKHVVLYYCGNEHDDKELVAQLIRDAGYEPIDAGTLAESSALQPGGPKYGREVRSGTAA